MRTTLLIALIIGAFMASCATDPKAGFDRTEAGLYYKLHVETGGPTAEVGDILMLEMVYKLNNDTIIFDSREAGQPVFLMLIESEYDGDIYEGFSMMAEGDSATFIIDAERFFMDTAHEIQLPAFARSGDEIFFYVKMLRITDEEGYMEEQMLVEERRLRENELRAVQEDSNLEEYLQEQGITEAPRESGLVYIEMEAGTGPRVQSGDMVAVHYEGRLLDGTVFDSSFDRGEPIEIRIGVGQVIPGWDEGITLMRQGGKARLIIPSYLGYGDRGAGNIIPHFPLWYLMWK
jgi:FKBP-type peptidyl-prolyl cis-trans isomerase FkpA